MPMRNKPTFKDNHPGPVRAEDLSPERLARAQKSRAWGKKLAEGMLKNLRDVKTPG